MRKIILSLFLATALSLSLTGAASAQLPTCPTVTADTTLTSDCLAPLVVNASAVEVNLNGHVVTGPAERCIEVTEKTGVAIRGPGTVTGCSFGVSISGGGTVKGVHITRNSSAGIQSLASDGNDFRENIVSDHHVGVDSRRSNLGKIEDNQVANNFVGIQLFESHQNSVRQNALSNNELASVLLLVSDSNRLDLNTAKGLSFFGIVLELGSENNLVEKNTATGLLLGLRDDNDNCDANVWRDNIFFDRANKLCIR